MNNVTVIIKINKDFALNPKLGAMNALDSLSYGGIQSQELESESDDH